MGALSALKGYRAQFLYSLNRVLASEDPDRIYHPEGIYEDLDILDSNHIPVEVIQVKRKSHTLVFSDLFSKESSFFRRGIRAIDKNDTVKLHLVSFSPISEELTEEGRLSKKLKGKGFKETEIAKILTHFTWELCQEATLEAEVQSRIKELAIFTDPGHAFEILLFWFYKTGEEAKEIRGRDIMNKLDAIGSFLSGQAAFQNQFGKYIRPFSNRTTEEFDEIKSRELFYYGVSARYEHIVFDLDVRRQKKLASIRSAFDEKNIVVVHGASGQGKSALAYRYVQDNRCGLASYELRIGDEYTGLYDTMASLEQLSKGLVIPVLLYIDVAPGNELWQAVLKEFSEHKHLNFLVTIRQEDWNKTLLDNRVQFYDLELSFNRDEALLIYQNLNDTKPDLKFTSFEESWVQFGGEGLLLEYVYLINQGNTLKQRLEAQILNIKKKVAVDKTEELEILRYVCLSDVLGARVDYKRLVEKLDIKTPKLYVDYFQKEYLLQYSKDRKYLRGLHPIRSEILCELLFDDEYVDIREYMQQLLPMINEQDIYGFLLKGFKKGLQIERLWGVLDKTTFKSWTAYAQILKGMLWKGFKDYVFLENLSCLEEMKEKYPSFWNALLPHDFSKTTAGGVMELFKENLPEEKLLEIEQIQEKFSSGDTAYKYARKWINSTKNIQASMVSTFDIKGLGDFFFWAAEFGISLEIDLKDLNFGAIKVKGRVQEVSHLMRGLSIYGVAEEHITGLKANFLEVLSEEYSIFHLKMDQVIDCRYFFDVIKYEDDLSYREVDFFNGRSMQIIRLLRNAFPLADKYSTKGFGFTFFDLELPYDPTVKNIEAKNLPFQELVEGNVLIGNLFQNEFRPSSWKMYVQLFQANREIYALLTLKIVQGFQHYFRHGSLKEFAALNIEVERDLRKIKKVDLPMLAVDEWGYVSEGNDINIINPSLHQFDTEKRVGFSRYKVFLKFSRDYFNSITQFLNEVASGVHFVYRDKSEVGDGDDFNMGALKLNLKEALINNQKLQIEFNRLFERFDEENMFSRIESLEQKALFSVFYAWNQFQNRKGNVNNKVIKNAYASFNRIKTDLNKRLLRERKRIKNKYGIQFDIELSENTADTLVLTAEVFHKYYEHSILVARELLQNTVQSDLFSAKRVFIDLNIDNAVFIPLVYGQPLHKKGIEIYLHNLDQDLESDEAPICFNFFEEIDERIADHLGLKYWNEEIMDIHGFERVMGYFVNLYNMSKQLSEIHIELEKSDIDGGIVYENYKRRVLEFFKKQHEGLNLYLSSFNNLVEDIELKETVNSLSTLFKKLPLEGEILQEVEEVQRILTEIYPLTAENAVLEIYGTD
jgi:hypothetical protein